MSAHNDMKGGVDGTYFHIYNKGVENRNLFNDADDYTAFLKFLKDYLTSPDELATIKKSFTVNGRTYQGVPYQPKNYFNKIELVAYSLMPNHFHLLVKQMNEGSIEKLIRSLCTRYAKYYNKKCQRRGSLFTRPYKSAQIKDSSQLRLLTRHFHRESLTGVRNDKRSNHNGHSSYDQYLGSTDTSWIKPGIVLSYFKSSESDFFRGLNGYRNFVEKYELAQNEREMLESIILERKPENFEKEEPGPAETKFFEGPRAAPSIKNQRMKTSEFVTSSVVVFLLLFSFGFSNVLISAAESASSVGPVSPPRLAANPAVSGATDVGVEEKVKEVEVVDEEARKEEMANEGEARKEEVPIEDEEEKQVEAEKEPRKILMVVIGDGSKSVNIRQKPTTDSEKVGDAYNGDHFEFTTLTPGWYGIKLDDDSIAYLSAKYVAEIEVEKNN